MTPALMQDLQPGDRFYFVGGRDKIAWTLTVVDKPARTWDKVHAHCARMHGARTISKSMPGTTRVVFLRPEKI